MTERASAERPGCSDAVPGPPPPLQNRRGPLRELASTAAEARRAPAPSHTRPAQTYLWGVTFCSILTSGNRRRAQPRQVRVASAPLTARPSITRDVGGRPLPLALQATVSRAALQTTPAAWRAPRARTAGKWRRPVPAGEPRERRPSARLSLFLPRPPAGREHDNPVSRPKGADGHPGGLQRAASIFEILLRAEWRGGQTPRAGRGPRGGVGGAYGVCTARRHGSWAEAKAISRRMDVDCNGGPRRLEAVGRKAASSGSS